MRGTGIHVILIEPGPITSLIRKNSIPHFERWIDWKNSARRAEYEKLLARLYGEKTARPLGTPRQRRHRENWPMR